MLDGTVDPEQAGVPAGDAEDVRAVVEGHLPVVVRDATAQRLDPSFATGPLAGNDRVDIHGAILSCRNGRRALVLAAGRGFRHTRGVPDEGGSSDD